MTYTRRRSGTLGPSCPAAAGRQQRTGPVADLIRERRGGELHPREVAELTVTVAAYNMVSRFLAALEIT